MRELYGTRTCPYTAELREELQWDGDSFVEYDVDTDPDAHQRILRLAGAPCRVPVLVEDGRVKRVGYQGRSCYVGLK